MNHRRLALLCLLFICFLTGCVPQAADARVQVFIQEAEGCTVENNGQYVRPGEDAVFVLTLDRDASVVGTDYSGTVHLDTQKQTTTLTVKEVLFPTRIRLELSYDYAQLTYHANGGYALHSLDDQITKSYSLALRSRPNTDTGTDMFAREGYTLLCWNTAPDGSGTRVGLGSRVTVPGKALQLYAQWAKWEDSSSFGYIKEASGITITGYTGKSETLVIPEYLEGIPVTAIAAGAFPDCGAHTVVLPKSMDTVAPDAFQGSKIETLVLFDNIVSISDGSFPSTLKTLYINAIEAPYGYAFRKESVYADKIDLLIAASGEKKLVFYGGCSMWYNLDGNQAAEAFGKDYRIINAALNGTVNSAVQLQILCALMEEGDILFHTPEFSSVYQMMTSTDMGIYDKGLWCGIENNYDLFAYVDMTQVDKVLDSLCMYLAEKKESTNYASHYQDSNGYSYQDPLGCIPFTRSVPGKDLADKVFLDPDRITETGTATLKSYYSRFQSKGVRVYTGFACINLDAVPPEQLENRDAVEAAFRRAMEGIPLLGKMEDCLYRNSDFYDTNYHLLSGPAKENTAKWLQALTEQLRKDGGNE